MSKKEELMSIYEGKNLADGQVIATEIIGEVAGVGAGGLIGAAALTMALNSDVGKLLKVVYCIGGIGITWAVQNIVSKETKTAMAEIFDGVNSLMSIFGVGKKMNSKNGNATVEAEATIE